MIKPLILFLGTVGLFLLLGKKKKISPEQRPAISMSTMEAAIIQYDLYIMAAAYRYDIEPALIAAIMARENPWGDPDREAFEKRVSDVSVGLMQIRTVTASEVCGLRRQGLKDAEANIECGTKYLAQLKGRFGKYLPALASGYNAGPGRVSYDPDTGTLIIVNKEYVEYVLSVIPRFRRILRSRWGSAYYDGLYPPSQWRGF